MNKQLINIIDENGGITEVDLISIIPSEKDDKLYIVYTDGKEDLDNKVDLLIAILNEGPNGLKLLAIESDEEYAYAKSLLEKQVGELNG